MSLDKKGQTYKQLLRRADTTINSLREVIQKLQKDVSTALTDNPAFNPRSKNSYKEEAQFMFTTLALLSAELRTEEPNVDLIKGAVVETLQQLGFNIVDQYENKCLKDGVYTNE